MQTILRSWKIGTACGIDLYIHSTFFLLPAWVFLSNLRLGTVAAALYLVFLTILVFACIILHELGHALMARHYGIHTRDITLYPIGGVARLERMSERPWEEFWISLAGPAVNVVIGGVLFALLFVARAPFSQEDLVRVGLRPLLVQMGVVNILLALFNLTPAFPMDGGRILRALLAARLGRRQATEVAAGLGLIFAVIFFLLSVTKGLPGFGILAVAVFLLGQQELWAVRRNEPKTPAVDVAVPPQLFPDMQAIPTTPDFSGFTWDRQMRLWIEWRNGRPVHLVSVE